MSAAEDEGSSSSDTSSEHHSPIRKRYKGRGRGRGRGKPTRTQGESSLSLGPKVHEGFCDPDTRNALPDFTPSRAVGIHLDHAFTRSMNREVEFFRLFFTRKMLQEVVTHTNAYAHIKVSTQPSSYTTKEGAWEPTNLEEIERLIAFLVYAGLVRVDSDVTNYWSVKTLYHGLWAREIISRFRYKAVMAFLHVVDPVTEDPSNKLRKVESFVQSFRERCEQLYQPSQNIAVDERMVKLKSRSGIIQFMKDKPTKWGIKLWVAADSSNGYTCNFEIYTGKKTKDLSEHGLGYDVVMSLLDKYLDQGYHVYFDNFYTSHQLVRDLFLHGTPCTGTVRINRVGFPQSLKDIKAWAKTQKRGGVRWVRESEVLTLQWVDNKPVSVLTTIDSANDQVVAKRRAMVDQKFTKIDVPQPKAIHRYNQYMNAVDRSDQLLACHNIRRKCYRWWKILFYHLVDMAIVNSFILFQKYRAEHEDIKQLQRKKGYTIVDFREAIVRQLCHLPDYDDPPVSSGAKRPVNPSAFYVEHTPGIEPGVRRNCYLCYKEGRGEKRVNTFCEGPECQRKYFHISTDYNCFKAWHSKACDKYR